MTIIENVLESKTLEDLQASKPVQPSEPKLTRVKVEGCVLLLKEIEQNNGYLGIAKKSGLSCSQVKEIHRAVKSKIADLTPVVITEEAL